MTSSIHKQTTESSKNLGTISRRRRIIIAVTSLILVLPIIYCCGLPYVTGQACIDFLSGQVPSKAEDIFFQRIFDAAVKEDYQWLATVTTDNALFKVKELQPTLSNNYEIVWGDDLAGEYERIVQFDNGTKVLLAFWGSWPSCPDFNVTEDEVFENLELIYIEEEID